MIKIPIFEFECNACGEIFEDIQVWTHHACKECKACGSPDITKLISSSFVTMDVDSIKHSLPDPVPPLRELVGRQRKGYEGGFKELENTRRELKEYTRHKGKNGNWVWLPKEKQHHDLGAKKSTLAKKRYQEVEPITPPTFRTRTNVGTKVPRKGLAIRELPKDAHKTRELLKRAKESK